MNTDEIKKLADLSRLKINDQDIEAYKKDFEGIINYINTLQSVPVDDTQREDYHDTPNVNTLRDDNNHYISGEFTRDLVDAAPEKEGDYIKVSKVL
jgi:aspartyl-tRNA(Asn)/glutamyl-tRNA(Gln) amidotransferase subunit C